MALLNTGVADSEFRNLALRGVYSEGSHLDNLYCVVVDFTLRANASPVL